MRKLFVVGLIALFVCANLSAYAWTPSKNQNPVTEATLETPEASPATVPSENSKKASFEEVMQQLEASRKIQKDRETAEKIATLSEAYEDLKLVNECYKAEIDRVHPILGLGLMGFPMMNKDLEGAEDLFGVHGLVGFRVKDVMVLGHVGYMDIMNIEEKDKYHIYGGLSVAYEF